MKVEEIRVCKVEDSVVVVQGMNITTNNELLSTVVDVKRFERFIKLLNRLLKQDEGLYYNEVCSMIYNRLYRACIRAKRKGILLILHIHFDKDSNGRDITFFTLKTPKEIEMESWQR